MKKTVLTQRHQFYCITPYKDYSLIKSKKENELQSELNVEMENVDFIDIFLREYPVSKKINRKVGIPIANKKDLKKKNTKYYYTDKEKDTIYLDPWFPSIETFYTTNEKHLKKHFGRPFSGVQVRIYERSITVEEDSISVRFYYYSKSRSVNNIYFKKTRSACGFKINTKKGNIIAYDGSSITSYKIRQNTFRHLNTVLSSLFSRSTHPIIGGFGETADSMHPINIEFKQIFNDEEFIQTFTHLLLSKMPLSRNVLLSVEKNSQYIASAKKIENLLISAFVDLNEIKVPNNYEKFLTFWYPTKEFLKKNDNKLIAAILDRIGIKSKSTVKLLHKYPDIDLSKLILLAKYFGFSDVHKYIHNIKETFFVIDFMDKNHIESMYGLLNNKYEYPIKDSEKKCLLRLINELMNEIGDPAKLNPLESYDSIIRSQLSQFTDHLDLLRRIREYIPETEMRATSLKEFHNEHIEFSKIERAIKKGYSIKYVFEDRLIDLIENPISLTIEDGVVKTFYPVLLKIDAEYSEEGGHMHHCVSSYADKDLSIIVSLREDSVFGFERVTSEFDVRDKSCIQSKYFCNAAPPEKFKDALKILKDRINKYKGSIKAIEKQKVPLIINGVQIKEQVEEETFIEYIERNLNGVNPLF